MPWFIFALLGTLLYVCVAFIDKYMVETRVPQSGSLIVYSGILNLCVSLLASVYFHIPFNLNSGYIPLLVSGALLSIGTASYFTAIKYIPISMVTFLFQLIPVLLFITSFLIYGETVTVIQISGVILLILGVIALTKERLDYGDKLSMIKGISLIVIYDLCWVAGALSIKSVPGIGIPQILVYELCGFGIASLLLLSVRHIRNDFASSLSVISLGSLGILAVNEGILFISAKTLMNYAYTIGKAGLVSSVESIQPVVSVFMGYGLTLIAPKIFQEMTDRRPLVRNVVLGLVVLLGLHFIT